MFPAMRVQSNYEVVVFPRSRAMLGPLFPTCVLEINDRLLKFTQQELEAFVKFVLEKSDLKDFQET